nr:liprin-beta-1-like [Biomphalaria glabrata]
MFDMWDEKTSFKNRSPRLKRHHSLMHRFRNDVIPEDAIERVEEMGNSSGKSRSISVGTSRTRNVPAWLQSDRLIKEVGMDK